MNIVHISAECFPAAKAGGLADVVGALPKYQNILGHKASVIMPHYYTKFRSENQYKAVFNGGARLGHHTYSFQVFQLLNENLVSIFTPLIFPDCLTVIKFIRIPTIPNVSLPFRLLHLTG